MDGRFLRHRDLAFHFRSEELPRQLSLRQPLANRQSQFVLHHWFWSSLRHVSKTIKSHTHSLRASGSFVDQILNQMSFITNKMHVTIGTLQKIRLEIFKDKINFLSAVVNG